LRFIINGIAQVSAELSADRCRDEFGRPRPRPLERARPGWSAHEALTRPRANASTRPQRPGMSTTQAGRWCWAGRGRPGGARRSLPWTVARSSSVGATIRCVQQRAAWRSVRLAIPIGRWARGLCALADPNLQATG